VEAFYIESGGQKQYWIWCFYIFVLSWYRILVFHRCFGQRYFQPQHYDMGAVTMKAELIDMLCRKSFKFSKEPIYKLVSGRMSQFYVNCKPVTLCARGMFLAGHLLFDEIKDDNVSAVGGLTFGADPLAVATAFASELNAKPINAFSIRKTRKDHGMIRWIEGDVQPGQRVAIIDDVATTGGSTIKAIDRARSEGFEVVRAVILVDRQEGGLENIRQHVAKVSSIITRDELMEHWRSIKGD
jgi:orotate phosphoribosyltransferase